MKFSLFSRFQSIIRIWKNSQQNKALKKVIFQSIHLILYQYEKRKVWKTKNIKKARKAWKNQNRETPYIIMIFFINSLQNEIFGLVA
jgi:ABC-type methionine transport system permease subunit